jgi:predicted polyphosphate/ATP-dependent NAD kinase
MTDDSLTIGLLVNPVAGLGGSLAMKGSDGSVVRERVAAMTDEERARAQHRAGRALAPLKAVADRVHILTVPGVMGEDAAREAGLDFSLLSDASTRDGLTSAEDTRLAAKALVGQGADLLVFAGGDGTARDVYDAVGDRFPVLGIPAGVKMHSGVFAVSPEAAGELLVMLAGGGLVGMQAREVRDIDEEAFRDGVVRARFYGEMRVPGEGRYLQQTKVGGRESHELVAAEIAAWLAETMAPETTYLIGPGSTTAAVMESLGLPNTLLGVDIVRDRQLIASDVDEAGILAALVDAPAGAHIVVTAIGGQGHVFGRGNQQFTPDVIRRVGVDNITIVAAKSKITGLEGRPLLVDTNDPELDRTLAGLREVLTGYDDHILYRVSAGAAPS